MSDTSRAPGRSVLYGFLWLILLVLCWPLAAVIGVLWLSVVAIKLCLHGTIATSNGLKGVWRWLDRATGPQYEVRRRRRA